MVPFSIIHLPGQEREGDNGKRVLGAGTQHFRPPCRKPGSSTCLFSRPRKVGSSPAQQRLLHMMTHQQVEKGKLLPSPTHALQHSFSALCQLSKFAMTHAGTRWGRQRGQTSSLPTLLGPCSLNVQQCQEAGKEKLKERRVESKAGSKSRHWGWVRTASEGPGLNIRRAPCTEARLGAPTAPKAHSANGSFPEGLNIHRSSGQCIIHTSAPCTRARKERAAPQASTRLARCLSGLPCL